MFDKMQEANDEVMMLENGGASKIRLQELQELLRPGIPQIDIEFSDLCYSVYRKHEGKHILFM